ncbi:MAG: tetraacyldisaccharide 4'-kinase, partial [Planctomycetes bacterium]|nr:tetraacyldisaccharide 4'-kinase [Planctomycetota bacterium]
MSLVHKLYARILDKREAGIFLVLLRLILQIFASPYELVVRTRRRLYESGFIEQTKLDRCVVSIGNLAVGGTGKTPLTVFLAKTLIKHGFRVAIISRGYKRADNRQNIVLVADGRKILTTVDRSGD